MSWLHTNTFVFILSLFLFDFFFVGELAVYFVKRIECHHNFVNSDSKNSTHYFFVVYSIRSVHERFQIWIWRSGCEVTLFFCVLIYEIYPICVHKRIYTNVYGVYARRTVYQPALSMAITPSSYLSASFIDKFRNRVAVWIQIYFIQRD